GALQPRAVQLPGRGVVQPDRQVREAQVRQVRRRRQPQQAGHRRLDRDAAAPLLRRLDSGREGPGPVLARAAQRRRRAAVPDPRPRPRRQRRAGPEGQHRSAPVGRPEAGQGDRSAEGAGPGPRGRLQQLLDLRHAGQRPVLVARQATRPVRQLGLGDHRPGGAAEAGAVSAVGGAVQVAGQDAQVPAARGPAQGALRRRQAEVPDGADGAVQEGEDQPGRRLSAAAAEHHHLHDALLDAGRVGGTAPRAVDAVDPRPDLARSVLRAASVQHRDHVGDAEADPDDRHGPDPAEDDAVHAAGVR
ncbi:hypothetical protein CATMIT_01626, partial [Catenibacterium mitsuokai DSM 15897]